MFDEKATKKELWQLVSKLQDDIQILADRIIDPVYPKFKVGDQVRVTDQSSKFYDTIASVIRLRPSGWESTAHFYYGEGKDRVWLTDYKLFPKVEYLIGEDLPVFVETQLELHPHKPTKKETKRGKTA